MGFLHPGKCNMLDSTEASVSLGVSDKGYVTSPECVFRYPMAGDDRPPGGAKVLLLTIGGVCVTGSWQDSGAFTGWAPLPKRDKEKEKSIGKLIKS